MDNRKIRKGNLRPEDHINVTCQAPRSLLVIPEHRSRKVDDKKVSELMDSIRTMGILQPVSVAKGPAERYTLIAGAHRVMAIQRIWDEDTDVAPEDQPTLPMIVTWVAEADREVVEIAENLHRNDLSGPERKALAGRYGELICINDTSDTNSENDTNHPKPGPKKSWFVQWYEGANIPRPTANKWWSEFKTATGETSTPAKASTDARAKFLQWLKTEGERKALEEKQAAEAAKANVLPERIANALDPLWAAYDHAELCMAVDDYFVRKKRESTK